MADHRTSWIARLIEPLRVRPGSTVDLTKDFDPGSTSDLVSKDDAGALLQQGVALLSEYQQRLAAQDVHGVLVCLQALDAAGKDGTIRHVMSGVNPQGVHVTSFRAPSSEELDHDFLWRYGPHVPGRGEIAIFNRSHYEEVLVVRVHPELLHAQKLPEAARGRDVWERRYHQINDWERHLVANGFPVVKILLNISKEEQRLRFLERLEEPDKNWKFSSRDVRERTYFDAYQKAFSEMLSSTSTAWAPWYVVPADHKWFARLCASAILADTLIELDPRFPTVADDERANLAAEEAALEAEAPPGAPLRRSKGKDHRHDEGAGGDDRTSVAPPQRDGAEDTVAPVATTGI